MDLDYTAADEAFRDEARQFLREHLPAHLQHKILTRQRLTRDEAIGWQRVLNQHGRVAPGWPVQYGGTGWSPLQRHIWAEECAQAGAPPVLGFGVNLLAPVLMHFASEEQKRHYLPRILNADDWWCQGYSEPGAGSDLASLKTRAVRDGDHYVVNGQKTWTTLAQHANMMFCLVRTSTEGNRQSGISFLLIDMTTPGITVRPIITLDGAHEVNDVFFDDVRVPVANRVGEENQGWTYAKFLLGHERTGIAAIGHSKREIARLKRFAGERRVNGKPLDEDPVFMRKVADVEMELMALEITALSLVAEGASRKIGAEASILKITGTEISQAISELFLEAAGPAALPWRTEASDASADDDGASALAAHYFNLRKITIFGGSNEIQKNVIAKMILGL